VTVERLRNEHGFAEGALDFVFLDHDKDAYLPDLERILSEGWLHPGAIVVADNVKFPGAPEYRAWMQERQGKTWDTIEHSTHVEYQSLLKDLVLESAYLGGPEKL
jgi:catechol O-methyltransferase